MPTLYDYNSKEYREDLKRSNERLGKWFIQRISITKKWSKGNILELGCGEFPVFKESVKMDIVKIDGCIQADCNKPFPIKKKFDTIIGLELIEHLWNVDGFLDECHSHLNKHGRLILSTPNILSWKTRINTFLGNPEAFVKHGGEHLWFFSAKTLSQKLKEHKFSVVDVKPLGRVKLLSLCNGFILLAEHI